MAPRAATKDENGRKFCTGGRHGAIGSGTICRGRHHKASATCTPFLREPGETDLFKLLWTGSDFNASF